MSTIDISAGTIHYEATGPADGRPVVFVHGYLMGGQLWRQVSDRLAGWWPCTTASGWAR